MPFTPTFPSLPAQADRLISLGLATAELHTAVAVLPDRPGLLALPPAAAPASRLAPLVAHPGLPGFVVEDMTDVDEFAPRADLDVPAAPAYLLEDVRRGDDLANWSPDEALPALHAADRTPLLLTEGLLWLLQQPEALERGRCFMTIGSRRPKPDGRSLDARTPAIWISNGTGRDGRSRRDAPKVGWCWAGNRHTWLGFASAAHRTT
ncbi:DUF5701 family protein [Kitasatospora sp. NPDC049285]|uniref:DUF5701 family protein n=1 Tax=Kitasatospora sp. NPDC049285 TaxID=3157096 RepID=UPI003448C083